MHQSHNIPWSTFEKHFTFVVEDKRYTPPFTGLIYKESPAAVKELQHFVRKFTGTINEFSETERKKYPVKIPPFSPNAKVFSDALRNKYPHYLNERFQSLSSWIDYTKHSIGYLKEAVMVLLFENEMETLLMLAQHPQTQIAGMLGSGCAHYHSGGHGEEATLRAYLLFNTMEATGQLSDTGYARSMQCRFLIHVLNMWRGSCGQYVALETLPRACDMDMVTAEFPEGRFVRMDFQELQEWLKSLFAVIYRYDVLAREVKLDAGWERMIKDNIIFQCGLPRETAFDKNNRPFMIALDV